MIPRDRAGEKALIGQLKKLTKRTSFFGDGDPSEGLYGVWRGIVTVWLLTFPALLALKPMKNPEKLASPDQSLAITMGALSFGLAVFIRHHFVQSLFASHALTVLPLSPAYRIRLALAEAGRRSWMPLLFLAFCSGLLVMRGSTTLSWPADLLPRVWICWLGIYGLASVMLLLREKVFRAVVWAVGGLLLAFLVLQNLGLIGLNHHAKTLNSVLWVWTWCLPGQALFSAKASVLPWVLSLAWMAAGAGAWWWLRRALTDGLESDADFYIAGGTEDEEAAGEKAVPLEDDLRREADRMSGPISEGWLEGLVNRLLRPCQRTLLATFGTRSASWSGSWKQFFLHALWVSPSLWVLHHPLNGVLPAWLHFSLVIWLVLFLVLIYAPRFLELPKLSNPICDSSQVAALGLVLPVSLRELAQTNRLVVLVRVLALTPCLVIVCCAVEWIFSQTCSYWWLYGLSVAACLPVLAPAAVVFPITQFTRSTGRFASVGVMLHVFFTLITSILFIGLFLWSVLAGTHLSMWQKVLAAVVMVQLWVWLHWSVCVWLLHRRRTAWIRPIQVGDHRRLTS